MTPGYRVTAHASLRERTTFGVPARAPWLIEVDDAAALDEVLALPQATENTPLVIGGGSNLLFAGDAPGAVIAMATRGLRVLSDDGDHARACVCTENPRRSELSIAGCPLDRSSPKRARLKGRRHGHIDDGVYEWPTARDA